MIKKNLKNLIISGLFLSFSLFYYIPLALGQVADGTYDFQTQSGLNSAAKTAGYETGANSTSVEGIISQVLFTILGLVGIIFFGYLIYGGYIWMTSRGNEERIKEANNTLVNAILGLLVTLGAYAISYFLISAFWS